MQALSRKTDRNLNTIAVLRVCVCACERERERERERKREIDGQSKKDMT